MFLKRITAMCIVCVIFIGIGSNNAFGLAKTSAVPSADGLPVSYDSRLCGVQTSVRSQGITSACWAIAALDCIQQNMQKQHLQNTDFAPAHLTWFAHRSLTFTAGRDAGDGTNIPNPYLHGGNWIDAAAALSRGNGPVAEQEYPFYPTAISSMGNYPETDRNRRLANLTSAVCYYSKDNLMPAQLDDETMRAVKRAIVENGAVQLSFYSDALRYMTTERGTAYYQNSHYTTNHAVVVIGWDDSFPASAFSSACRPQKDGAWLCKNSWGEEWGEDGCFWLSYDDVSLNQIVGYTATSVYRYEDIYQYDGFGFHGRVYSNDYIRFVNVYTADSDCEITAVGTWLLQDNSDYTVEVFRLERDLTSCADALSYVSTAATVPYYGYYVTDLDETLWLKKGDIFAVCVTLTADADCPTVNAPIENVSADDYSCYSEPGQSFVQIARNGTWYDTSAQGLNNVCLKALTAHRHKLNDTGNLCTQCGAVAEWSEDLFVKMITCLFAHFIRIFDSYIINK